LAEAVSYGQEIRRASVASCNISAILGIMSLTYADVGAHIFGEREFDAGEFGRRTENPRPAKVLSELAIRGVVGRKGRGHYRFLRPSERPDLRIREWERVREIVLNGPGPKAWDGASAVEMWTSGRYRVSPSMYLRTYSVAVPAGHRRFWVPYLAKRGLSLRSRKRVGARVEIREVPSLRLEKLDGEPVLPRTEVVALIRAHPGIFAGAEALLNERTPPT
jgi:hypothetical protein